MILKREKEDEYGTHGQLYFDEDTPAGVYTLEQPWRDNQHDISCIPPGPGAADAEYPCITHNSDHFKDVWEVTNVPGRAAILIHAGNTVIDTHGCILVGLTRRVDGVGNSQDALAWLRTHVPAEFTLRVCAVQTSAEQSGGNS